MVHCGDGGAENGDIFLVYARELPLDVKNNYGYAFHLYKYYKNHYENLSLIYLKMLKSYTDTMDNLLGYCENFIATKSHNGTFSVVFITGLSTNNHLPKVLHLLSPKYSLTYILNIFTKNFVV